jgi:DNA-binding NarL/FixJ family response regulator
MAGIFIIDDHIVIRKGLNFLITSSSLHSIAGEASGLEQLKENDISSVNLFIIDINLADSNGFTLVDYIREKNPEAKIIIYTVNDSNFYIQNMLNRQVNGYLIKNDDEKEVLECIEKVLAGELYLGKMIREKILSFFISHAGSRMEGILTEKEIEVIRHICRDLTSKEIAAEMNLSIQSIDLMKRNIAIKLNVSGVSGIIKYAIINGLVDIYSH